MTENEFILADRLGVIREMTGKDIAMDIFERWNIK